MITLNKKQILLKNNAISTLGADLKSTETVMKLETGGGSKFPVITEDKQYFYVTISSKFDPSITEIVKVIATDGDNLTIVRAQDGTTATDFQAGDSVEMRITKALLEDSTFVDINYTPDKFIDLLDTPNEYKGYENLTLRVKPDGTGIEFKKYHVVSETPLVADYVGVGAPSMDLNPKNTGDIYFDRDKGHFWKCLDNTENENIWKNLQTGEIIQKSTITRLDIFSDGSAVALWQFENNANDTGGVYNGKWEGEEQYDVGKFGQAAKFNGKNSYIDIQDPVLLDNNIYSVFLWVKILKYSRDNSGSFSKYNGHASHRFIFGEYSKRLGIFNGILKNWKTGSKLELNKWYHIGFVMHEDKTEVYLNGELDFTVNAKIRFENSYPVTFGSTKAKGYTTNQLIDQVRIFNRTLTSDEVQTLYNEK